MTKPAVGRIVHYVSYGTPGGEYDKECRAAVITQANPDTMAVGLAVLNPTGMFFNTSVNYDDGTAVEGSPDCQSKDSHGNPFRYCPCGWMEATKKGGTWHWPERV